MAEGAGAYFEDHKESRDLGCLALRGGIASVAMQYGNTVLQIVAAVILLKCVGLGSLWVRPLRRSVLGGPDPDS
jgi:hypothetical protein